MSDTRKLALVIGATGGVGGATAKALLAHGWRVRALTRNLARAARDFAALGPVEWVPGDAMDRASVVAAGQGARLIIHGANPPGYRNWRGLALPMLENSIAAAKASGARLVLPGNVYNFGPDAFPVADEQSPQHPLTRKGKVRVEMEAMLRHAAAADGVHSLIVRAGDYFGANAPSSWFENVLVKPGKPVGAVTYPGARDVGHCWAYLPDLGEAIAQLAALDDRLADCETVHFGGYWLERGDEIAQAVRRVVGRPDLPIRALPWPAIYLAAPFVTMLREMLEMRYLWRKPLRLDNRKLIGLLGAEPHRPLDEAIRRTLIGLGCLPQGSSETMREPALTPNPVR
jgi:nucleoside-diphosphate-sugar epimerase